MAGELMRKPVCLKFGTVHKNYAAFGIGVYFVFAVCLGVQLAKIAITVNNW